VCCWACRNPLHALSGSASMMLGEARMSGGGGSLARDLALIVSGSAYISRLISDLAEWSIVRSGVRPVKRESVDVVDVLSHVVGGCCDGVVCT
jgi:signal transduction histidine kinase